MYRFINSILIFYLVCLSVSAQDLPDFRQVDIETYRLYTEEKWDSLIGMGEPAIKRGIDYYYLRMRTGIAWYEKRNYIKSSGHFKKAIEFSTGDQVALEYLYYAYLLSGHADHARFVTKQFPESLIEKTDNARIIEEVNASFFYNNSATDKIINNSSDYFPTDIPGYQVITRQFSNFSFLLKHKVAPGISLQHAYTHLYKVNFNFLNNGTYIINNSNILVKQHQYYFSANKTFSGRWDLAPAIHIIHTRYPLLTSISQGGPGRPTVAQYTEQKETSLLAGLRLSKSFGPVDLRLRGHGSNLNNQNQLQGAAGLTYYPFGNLDVYISGDVVVHSQSNDSSRVNDLILNGMVGFTIAQKIWLEFSASLGDMENYAEKNGYLIFNSTDILNKKIEMNLAVPVTEKGSLIYAGARHSSFSSYLTSLINPEISNLNELTYNSLSFYGGVLWKF